MKNNDKEKFIRTHVDGINKSNNFNKEKDNNNKNKKR